ncbi:pseudouridine synthase [Meiothermus granaticius]|uniref:Pseudouridine synthase n=1 Tax=Meiothermus granaticius NBRC 107808 TaxID=1227551 RepID=A0A399F9Q5_9DEIN|nr:pseudouridine synthase [Meiothermus granaticius]MCL6526497.1 pseudouridine synthase [Thermaceae bacterium]RIH92880.1 putative RNA pseudouridine synthase [Meiothermus granaticius NBRC 107808]GEM86736.1 hypothetical protein MGR01S_13610 [Meiothermus granaticius NBRC 107808]
MRLQQYLARAGVASRRKAEALIRAGRVSVNGQIVEIGATVGQDDVVRLDGERVRLPQKTVTIALNKPKGYTTTHEDAHAERLVYELVPEHPGLHSVGRLDKDTEGLLLLTTDGELTHFLSHPKNAVPKLYRAWSKRGRLSREECRQLEQGVLLGDGLARALEARPTKEGVLLVLTEGRKREVRRMLGRIGHPVLRLVRLAVGPVELGELKEGEWRYLAPGEVQALLANAPVAWLRHPEAPARPHSPKPKARASRPPAPSPRGGSAHGQNTGGSNPTPRGEQGSVKSSREHLSDRERPGSTQRGADRSPHSRTRRANKK